MLCWHHNDESYCTLDIYTCAPYTWCLDSYPMFVQRSCSVSDPRNIRNRDIYLTISNSLLADIFQTNAFTGIPLFHTGVAQALEFYFPTAWERYHYLTNNFRSTILSTASIFAHNSNTMEAILKNIHTLWNGVVHYYAKYNLNETFGAVLFRIKCICHRVQFP